LLHAASLLAVTIDFVTVGNPGNAADMRFNANRFGEVDYTYRIGKYEITAGQYTEFLNAVAAEDTFGLYNTLMWSDAQGAKIERIGSAGGYNYRVAADWANRPVNFVSFWDAARFVNWLHNGQPSGPQGPGTTEDGAYLNIEDKTTFARQPRARYFIPTEDEWYKAAYHNNAGETDNYWLYPTASNTAPINTLPDPGNHANFYDYSRTGNSSYTIGGPYYRTEVGAFENSASPYGTFDQGGNVQEWNETVRSDSLRGVRGGSFGRGIESGELSANAWGGAATTLEWSNIGFRIASLPVPEPCTLILFTLGLIVATCQPRLAL
jgi:formylglycine-generating enzyme required for sulfatase activity